MELLGEHFSVLAPDTPGYGLSDPLSPPDAEPGIDDFVDALARLLNHLQTGPVYLFGMHTGAILATRLAAKFPQCVHCLVANGVLVNSAAERADLVQHYFPAFKPSWDGAHLAWLWSRIRDQFSFFPWYGREPEQRYAGSGDLAQMETSALEFLQAGDNYRAAYRAVIDYAIADDMMRLSVPTCMLVAEKDPLSASVPFYPALPEQVSVQVVPEFSDIPPAVLEFYLAQPQLPAAAPRFPSAGLSAGIYRDFLSLAWGSVHLRRSRAGVGPRPLLCLHAPGGSSQSLEELLRALSAGRTVIAPDLPGHGDTVLQCEAPDSSVLATAEFLTAFLASMDREFGVGEGGEGEGASELAAEAKPGAALPFDVLAIGESWVYAEALRDLAPDRVHACVYCNPVLDADELPALIAHPAPDLTADEAGSQLQRAWFYLRDRRLFHPWYRRAPENVLHGLRRPSPQRMHEELLDLLKSRSVLPESLRAAWQFAAEREPTHATLLACDWHPAREQRNDVGCLPDEPYRWSSAVDSALERAIER